MLYDFHDSDDHPAYIFYQGQEQTSYIHTYIHIYVFLWLILVQEEHRRQQLVNNYMYLQYVVSLDNLLCVRNCGVVKCIRVRNDIRLT